MSWPDDGRIRCPWCLHDAVSVAYHDREWGVPTRDERRLFEMLILEGQQAGLSWFTILKKREAYRAALAGFDPDRLARFTDADVDRLVTNAGIVRNRGKLEAAIGNARAFVGLRDRRGPFADWLWAFVDGEQIVHRPRFQHDVPSQCHESRKLSTALRSHGFRYVGPTICYAYMQAVGLVDDHLADCFRAGATVTDHAG